MRAKSGWLLLWALAGLRVLGGLPYTWKASGHHDGLLHPTRRRFLLALSSLVVVYLTTTSIYATKITTLEIVRRNPDMKASLTIINNILVHVSPLVLIISALWKADKMANILRLISLVKRHTTNSSHSGGRHTRVYITLMVTILCSAVGPIFVIKGLAKHHSSLVTVMFAHAEIVFYAAFKLTLVILTTLLLELTDLTDSVTSSLAGFQDARHAAEQMTLFENTLTNGKDNDIPMKMNISLISSSER